MDIRLFDYAKSVANHQHAERLAVILTRSVFYSWGSLGRQTTSWKSTRNYDRWDDGRTADSQNTRQSIIMVGMEKQQRQRQQQRHQQRQHENMATTNSPPCSAAKRRTGRLTTVLHYRQETKGNAYTGCFVR